MQPTTGTKRVPGSRPANSRNSHNLQKEGGPAGPVEASPPDVSEMVSHPCSLLQVRDIMQDRLRINAMMQTTLPSFHYEQQAARQHLRALAVSENLQRNLRQEQGLQLELATTFFSQVCSSEGHPMHPLPNRYAAVCPQHGQDMLMQPSIWPSLRSLPVLGIGTSARSLSSCMLS